MVKYKLNDETFDVSLEEEEQFKIDNPDAIKVEEVEKTTPESLIAKEEEKKEEEEKKKPIVEENLPTENILAEEKEPLVNTEIKDPPKEQIIETDLSQDNQQENITEDVEEPPMLEEDHGIHNVLNDEGNFVQEEAYQWSDPNRDPDKSIFSDSIFDKDEKKEETKYIEGIGEVTVKSTDPIGETKELLKNNLPSIDHKDWDAMSEEDKNKIPGWENLPVKERKKWETYFEVNRPIEIFEKKGDEKEEQKFMLGTYNLASPDFWNRDYSYKAPFIKQLIEPLGDNYTIESITHKGEGIKLYTGFQIKHKDGEVFSFQPLDEERQHKNPKVYGSNLFNFFEKTLSEEDKVALNRDQHWKMNVWNVTRDSRVTLTKEEKQAIENEVNSIGDDPGSLPKMSKHPDLIVENSFEGGAYELLKGPGFGYQHEARGEYEDYLDMARDETKELLSDGTRNPDYNPLEEGESLVDRAKKILIEERIQEAQDKKMKTLFTEVDSDDFMDTVLKYGSEADTQKTINEAKTLNNVITTYQEDNIKPIANELAIMEQEFLEGEDFQYITHESFLKNAGVFMTIEEQENAIKEIVDGATLKINEEEVPLTEEGYQKGLQKIKDKYTFPTKEEYQDKFNEIQSKISKGEISFEEGGKLWKNYENELIDNENKLNTELGWFHDEYVEHSSKIDSQVENLLNDQAAKIEKAKIEFETQSERLEDYVVLGNGKKVHKIKWEEYQVLQDKFKKEQEKLGNLFKESEELITKAENKVLQNYLVQKNWNNWEKFSFNFSTMMKGLILDTSYALIDLSAFATGQLDSDWKERVDKKWQDRNEYIDEIRESYYPDVKLEDAFKSWGNFGKFFTQELAVNGPALLTIGLTGGLGAGRVGIGFVGGQAYPESMREFHRLQLENPGIHYSEAEKRVFSLIYAGAEGADAIIHNMSISRFLRSLTTGRKAYIDSGLAAIRKEIKNQMAPTVGLTTLGILSEVNTTMIQNWAVGRPWNENLDHAAVSAGMFEVIFAGFPLLKGSVMASFSDPKINKTFRNNLQDIQDLKLELNNPNLDLEIREAIESQIVGLESDNDIILDNEINKLSNMSPEFTETFFSHLSKSANLKRQYKNIKNDLTLDPTVKNKTLKNLENQFNNNEALLNVLKTDPAFGEKFFGFEKSIKKEDVIRRNEIFEQARTELVSEGKSEPSDKAVRDRARIIYNTQEIMADYNRVKDSDLAANFMNFETVDQAIDAVNNMAIDPETKVAITKEIKDGSHGATVPISDPKTKKVIEEIPFQVVENMAKDSRLETRTHEKGHTVLKTLFKNNPRAFDGIANDIYQYLQNHDIGSYLKLKTRVGGYKADVRSEEVITNFMEMVVGGDVDISKGSKNKTLPTILGFSFNKILSDKTDGKAVLGLQGETDALVFISTLAKKIKDGTIKLSDIEASKESDVVKKYEDFKTEKSKGFMLSRKSALDAINDLLPNNIKTKKDYYKFIRNERKARAINEALINPGGVINNYIRSKQTSKQEGDKVIEKTLERIFNFDPEATRQDGKKVGNQGFGEFLFSNTNFAKLDARKALFQESQQKQKEVSGDVVDDMGRTVFENTETEAGLTPEEIMIAKQETETPAFKRKRQETLDDLLKLDDNLKQDIVNSLKLAFGTKLPEIATNRKQAKLYEAELLKIVTDRTRIKIQKKFGTELKFNEFIKNDLTPLLNFIKDEDLRQLERMVGGKKFPNGRKIFTTSTRIIKKQEIIDLQKKGLIPITFTKYAQGYNLATRLPNPNSKELLAFFRGTNAEIELGYQPPGSTKSGMLGARKDKLAELLTREIAKSYAMDVVKDPKVLQKITDIEALQNRIIKDSYISELGAILDRDPDAGSINTDDSSVKFSLRTKKEVIEQVDLMLELIEEFGIDNVINLDGFDFLFMGVDENIAALAISTAIEIHNSGVLERGESKQYKTAVYKSTVFNQDIKDALKEQGALRRAIFDDKGNISIDGRNLSNDMGTIAEELGFEIMRLMKYDILGFYNRLADSAEKKEKPEWKNYTKKQRAELIEKYGKDYKWQRDKNNNFVSGPFHGPLQSIKGRVSNKKSDISDDVLKDVRLMNKKFSGGLFDKIQKVLDKPISREDKIAELSQYKDEVEAANIANIKLAKHIAKKVITLAREGRISKLSAINFFQLQTNAVGGLRALTRLDLIEVLDGPQIMSENHPQYQQALEYELNLGKLKAKGGLTLEQVLIKEKLTSHGEHINPNANTMFELVELIDKQNLDLDTELDLIFNDHSQLLSSNHLADLIDVKEAGGKTSTAGFSRLNILKPETLKNVVSIDGKSFQDVKTERGFSMLEKEIVKEASAKYSKSVSMSKAKNNLIKFSKKPKTKGMSTFDFDDTLARTKSGVRYTIPNNTGKPMPGKKVIFLAGSAGSGKSNVVKQLGLEGKGFKVVNQDISLEWLAKNSGLPTNMRDFTPEQASKWGELQWEARDIAQRKATKFRGRGDGVVVDGTGASTISMFTQAQKYEDAGYDVQMLFVDTSLETALARNKARKERSLKDFIVERNWKAVQKNKKAFKEEFGNNFAEVNTDNLKQGDPMPKSLVNKMNKFTDSYIKGRLTAEEFANKGGALLEQGAKFDFSEFNKVVDGTPGPLLEKARNRAKKYGTKDMFVLTARPQASAFAIQQFLKGQGLDIPIKNITGLANSTGDAKAQWMLDKFAEGYNDMYFVDDAIQNVEAVRQVLNQLDIKSKVVQAKVKFSKNASKEFNTIIEESQGTKADKIISQAAAKKLGRHKGWWRIFVPASAEDFKGLMYRFLGRGEQGNRHMAWFKDHLFDPFAKGIRSWNNYKQGMVNEYKALKKEFKDIKKTLNTKVKGTDFNSEQAVRVYLWDKAGFDVPGLDNNTKTKLVNHVLDNTRLKTFADTLSKITRIEEGYVQPRQGWSIGNISMDLNEIVNKIGRKQFLQDWIENKNAIFTPDNMNKIEALYGTGFRNALENMLYRMEHGGNRRMSTDKNVNRLLDWINGSVGAIMFVNVRSALLQTISTVNFINVSDNNIFKAGIAFANQKQFWNDFVMLFNSPMLKQRRAGIQIDVSASELSRAFKEGRGTPQGVISWLLEKGFTPTQVADSFAIAFGGASFYRNRYKKYIKEGMSPKEANEQAMLDFQEIAEETQQSSREDLISQQQASVLGRIVLAFQNVTMQMTRKTKKHLSDLTNRRRVPGYTQTQSDMANVGGIMYYGVAQNIIFLSLQSALAMYIWGDEDDEEIDKKTKKVINGSLDSFLSGTGLHGAIAKTIKNTISVYKEEKEKGWNREDGKVLLELMSFSPPIGSKLRKIWNALKTEQYNEGVSEELGWRIENPDLYFWASIIEAATNIPTQRLVKKMNNLEEAITGNHLMWQRIMMGLGWSGWTIGVKDEELEAAKEAAKEKRAEDKKIEKEEQKLQEKEEEEKEKKEKGIKTIRCSGIRSNGERCGNTTETDKETWLCYHHAEFTDGMDRDGDGIKEYRCTAIKSNGERCKNKTENKSKKCYAHQ